MAWLFNSGDHRPKEKGNDLLYFVVGGRLAGMVQLHRWNSDTSFRWIRPGSTLWAGHYNEGKLVSFNIISSPSQPFPTGDNLWNEHKLKKTIWKSPATINPSPEWACITNLLAYKFCHSCAHSFANILNCLLITAKLTGVM